MPELYEVVGAILRDIAQARAISDLYSRDISRFYEADPVLRNFPVPRAEISEASFNVVFAIGGVSVDPARRNVRNARISEIFESYAGDIVRLALVALRTQINRITSRSDITVEQRAALTAFQTAFLSEEYRNRLRTRLVRYFEVNRDALVDQDGNLDRQKAETDIKGFIEGLTADPVMAQAVSRFGGEVGTVEAEMLNEIHKQLDSMGDDMKAGVAWAKDFKIDVDVTPEKVQSADRSLCSISVKSTIRNYTWSKVDEDPKGLHSIRTLQPE